MTEVLKLAGGLRHQPVALVTGRIADPMRIVGIAPNVEHAPLAAGSTHLALPEWSPHGGGPMIFQITAGDSGANLTGMGEAVAIETIEYSLLGALILIIITAGIVTTTADDPASPVGSRFLSAVTMTPGTAYLFICSSIGGVKKWVPLKS